MSLRRIRPSERTTDTAQTSGMRREAAIAPETAGSVGLWAGFMETAGGTRSGAHHHGDAESGIYVLKGQVRFSYGEGLQESFDTEPGDFIYVPPQHRSRGGEPGR